MSSALAETRMASDDARKTVAYQIRCEAAWIERVRDAARRLSLHPAAYIRMVVTQRMDQDNIPAAKKKK
jgi:hypothetical protein